MPRFFAPALHRNLALLTLVFLGLHIFTAVVDPFTNLGWLPVVLPFSSYYRTFWLGLGTIALELLIAVTVTSLLRGIFGHRTWRAIHWLTYAAWPVAIVHGLGTGTDAWSVWLFAITCCCVGAVAFAAVYRLATGSTDPLAAPRASFRAGVDRRPDR
jgi:sulfoxide reductase heme-binding subunit YedZ